MASSDGGSSGIVMPLDCTLSSLACSRSGTDANTDGTEASGSSLKHLAKIEELSAMTRGRRREEALPAASGKGSLSDEGVKSGDSNRTRSDAGTQSVPDEYDRNRATPRGSRQTRSTRRSGSGRRMPFGVNPVKTTPKSASSTRSWERVGSRDGADPDVPMKKLVLPNLSLPLPPKVTPSGSASAASRSGDGGRAAPPEQRC